MKKEKYESQLNLRRVMMKKNVSDAELAEQIGICQQYRKKIANYLFF